MAKVEGVSRPKSYSEHLDRFCAQGVHLMVIEKFRSFLYGLVGYFPSAFEQAVLTNSLGYCEPSFRNVLNCALPVLSSPLPSSL